MLDGSHVKIVFCIFLKLTVFICWEPQVSKETPDSAASCLLPSGLTGPTTTEMELELCFHTCFGTEAGDYSLRTVPLGDGSELVPREFTTDRVAECFGAQLV